MATLAEQTVSRVNLLYFFCVYFSLFIFVARPGEIFPALSGTKLGLVSLILSSIVFFMKGGPQVLRQGKFPGLKQMHFFLGLGFFVIVFSSWPRHAFEGWHTILLVNTALYIFWLPSVRSSSVLRGVVKLFVVAGSVLALSLLFAESSQVVKLGRVSVGATYDPNDIAMVLAVVFPINVALFLEGKVFGKLLWGVSLACLLLGILATGSRGGMLSLAVATLLLLFATGKMVKAWHKVFVVLLLAGMMMSPAADSVKERWQAVISGVDYNIENPEEGGVGRLSLWISGLQLVAGNPLTGVGINNTSNAMGIEYRRWRSLHNSYLQAGLEMGLLGLALFVILLRTAWKNCSQALIYLDQQQDQRFFSLLAVCTRISLVSFMVAAFFLSQAYSLMLPVLLLISNGLYFISETEKREDDLRTLPGNGRRCGE